MTFPPTDPYAQGHLPVGGREQIWWETSGNPDGLPALTLHGGPGSGLGAGYRQRFDPARFLIVGLDQRGCGRSRPLASDPWSDLAGNTTQALIADLEALRVHLGIERWLVTGLSWGSTLAIAYAVAHPERVLGIVLLAVTTTSPAEVEWLTESVGRIFPEEWDRFRDAAAPDPGQRLIDAYHDLVTDADPDVRARAARDWCAWEDVHVSMVAGYEPDPRYEDPVFRAVFATLVIHYMRRAGFLGDPGLIAGVPQIGHVPAVLIHGRRDVSSPLRVALDVHRVWPASQLVVVDDEGHGGPAMMAAMEEAIARWASAAT